MAGYRIIAYDAAGAEVKNMELDGGEDGPGFYAHQLLHADVIVRVQVFDRDTGQLLVDRSEPSDAVHS